MKGLTLAKELPLMKEALRLYRESLKMLRALPESHSSVFKSKMAYNFREIFEIHRKEQDPERVAKLLQDYHNDVSLFRDLFTLSPEIVGKLLPIFDVNPKSESASSTL